MVEEAIDLNEIVLKNITLMPGDFFDTADYARSCKFFIPITASDVLIVASDHYNHESIAEQYVEGDEKLKAEFEDFKHREHRNSYKDFFVLCYDAIAVNDKPGRRVRTVVFGETDNRAMKKILDAYRGRDYKLECIVSNAPKKNF